MADELFQVSGGTHEEACVDRTVVFLQAFRRLKGRCLQTGEWPLVVDLCKALSAADIHISPAVAASLFSAMAKGHWGSGPRIGSSKSRGRAGGGQQHEQSQAVLDFYHQYRAKMLDQRRDEMSQPQPTPTIPNAAENEGSDAKGEGGENHLASVFHSVMTTCADAGQWEAVASVYDDMKAAEVELPVDLQDIVRESENAQWFA
jgi:pentatricopeptide repeat protein